MHRIHRCKPSSEWPAQGCWTWAFTDGWKNGIYAHTNRYVTYPCTLVRRQIRLQWYLTRSIWNSAYLGHEVFVTSAVSYGILKTRLDPGRHRDRMSHRPITGRYDLECQFFLHLDLFVVISDPLTTHLYRDDILGLVLRHLGHTFQKDKARPHKVSGDLSCFPASRTYHWPARSTDLFP